MLTTVMPRPLKVTTTPRPFGPRLLRQVIHGVLSRLVLGLLSVNKSYAPKGKPPFPPVHQLSHFLAYPEQ